MRHFNQPQTQRPFEESLSEFYITFRVGFLKNV